MFNHLESMYLSDLLEEVRVSGHHASGQRVSMQQLSEGERQLVLVFGLLLFTHEDEVLYLLDEPDSHLNPRWVYEYMDWLGKAFRSKEGGQDPNQNPLLTSTEPNVPGASQVILATHNPLMIGTLRRNQVRIMPSTTQQSESDNPTEIQGIASEPEFDPVGMGIEGLMKNEFGLRTTLATEILEKLDRHYLLLGKADKTDDEALELIRLGEELNSLAVSRTHPNPYFEMFANAMAQRLPTTEPVLTMQELQEQTKLADEILAEILEEEQQAAALDIETSSKSRSSKKLEMRSVQTELFVDADIKVIAKKSGRQKKEKS